MVSMVLTVSHYAGRIAGEVEEMRIDTFRFGSIKIDGRRYGKDVLIQGGVR